MERKPITQKQRLLIRRLNQARMALKALKKELRDEKASWAIQLWMLIEDEVEELSIFYNPWPVKVKATYGGKSLIYEIRVVDILCILSEGRVKYIYTKKPYKNEEGPLQITEKIMVDQNDLTLEKLCKHMDSLEGHLVVVGRGKAINMAHYHFSGSEFEAFTKSRKHTKINTIKSGTGYIENYIERKKWFDDFRSLQRLRSRYKESQEDKE